MHFRSRIAVAVGLLTFAFAALGPAVEPARADSWTWPTSGRITQGYGCTGFSWERSYGNCRHFHRGIDIANASGTKVHAASSGVVKFVGWNPWDRPGDRAWIVIIRHDNGTTGWYAHMLAKRVRGASAGQRVQAGQLIGYMGSTGRSTGVHLHFALQRNGAPVDPMRYLDGRPAGATARETGNDKPKRNRGKGRPEAGVRPASPERFPTPWYRRPDGGAWPAAASA